MSDNESGQTEIIRYKTSGTCCGMIQVAIRDGIIEDAMFAGGCNGKIPNSVRLFRNLSLFKFKKSVIINFEIREVFIKCIT